MLFWHDWADKREAEDAGHGGAGSRLAAVEAAGQGSSGKAAAKELKFGRNRLRGAE